MLLQMRSINQLSNTALAKPAYKNSLPTRTSHKSSVQTTEELNNVVHIHTDRQKEKPKTGPELR